MVSTTENITESITVIMAMKNNTQNTGSTGKRRIWQILAVAFGICFICCAVWLIRYFIQLKQAEAQWEALQASVAAEQESLAATEKEAAEKEAAEKAAAAEKEAAELAAKLTEESPQEPESLFPGLGDFDVPEKDLDFDALRADTNEHIYAWIKVPGTVIDYPVLQHPEEISYYLDHNLDHSKGYPGCIYTELFNSKEWDDPMTVIYGHNMKNGTMFAGLHQYRDPLFFEENPYIYIYTEEQVKVYQIFAAYEYSDMDLVQMYQLGGMKMYASYLDSIYTLEGMSNNFNTEIEVTTEDRLLTLATCISNKPTQRYLVQGIQVAEGTRE